LTTGLILNTNDTDVNRWRIVMLAEAVPPVPDSVAVIFPVVLLFIPMLVAVTLTEKEQTPLAAIDPAAREIPPEPGFAVIIPRPHVPVSPLGVATTSPAGRLSVNPTPVRPIPLLGFVIVNVRVVLAFTGIVAAPKALTIVGGAATVRLAVAVLPVPPFVDVTLPVVFVY
jgi:hypothetical protein